MMEEQISARCPQHPNREDCPDAIVSFAPQSKSYGIYIHDGGSSSIAISFCPWCGTRLSGRPPASKRGGG